uniref:SEC7 domain-containing protein n=1 Tax=Trichobilharzia regenti TaxID=157069 RepID=A0AA85IW33_TRIRE|nr:unnamed protein product [Trichobilharzia regenti]
MAPSNTLCMIQSEVSLMLTALRCSHRNSFRVYQDDSKKPLLLSFGQLRSILNVATSVNELEPLVYLTPFLEVIRSEDTTGPVTGLALTAVDKFLSYGLLELPPGKPDELPLSGPGSLSSIAMAVEAIADASTQARFVGTDPRSAEVVLMKVLHLLRTLLLVPAGTLVSDRAVREILQSCFRICFEPKLSELLRRTAELCLASMIQLFFSRLPTLTGFRIDRNIQQSVNSCSDIETAVMDKQSSQIAVSGEANQTPLECRDDSNEATLVVKSEAVIEEIPCEMSVCPNDDYVGNSQTACSDPKSCSNHSADSNQIEFVDHDKAASTFDFGVHESSDPIATQCAQSLSAVSPNDESDNNKLTVASTQSDTYSDEYQPVDTSQPQPYTIAAVYDLLSYLIYSLSPVHNNESVISISLGLITIALETGADAIANSPRLLQLVRGDLTKYLMLLLSSEDVWQFAATLRVCFLLFESMRSHLKLQMEVYLQRLTAICSSDNDSTGYEFREIALDSVVRLFLVPGLATELYVNYDCDPYCSNLFEDITKMLAKNAFPVERLMGTHLLALDALLVVLNTIEIQCSTPSVLVQPAASSGMTKAATTTNQNYTDKSTNLFRYLPLSDSTNKCKLRLNRHYVDSTKLPSRDELNASKAKKKLLMLGSDQFNVKPKRGITFLQEHSILQKPLNYDELAVFLRENPRLEKRMIGEYISERENVDVLAAFVRQFNFVGVPIDEALRAYVEAFRLPGEAPLIQRIMEHFAEHWYKSNNSPFVDVDAAFTLAYAILMLNTDQHNPNSKRQNAPMRMEDFKKNLSGMNGNQDFDPKLLESIFNNIHNNEIVMPIEQTGLVRENYLWKCLLRRSSTKQAQFIHLQTGVLDADLFELIWGPTVSALSFIFDKTTDPEVQNKAVDGFHRCATIAAYYGMSDVLDNLVISLCKFTTLLTANDINPTNLSVLLGRNTKACLALRLVFSIASKHADILRYGWHSLLDCLLQLFRANLIPYELLESQDFLTSSRKVYVTTEGCIPMKSRSKSSRHSLKRRQKTSHSQNTNSNRELGVFSSFYQYLTTGSTWIASGDEEDESKDDDSDDDDVDENGNDGILLNKKDHGISSSSRDCKSSSKGNSSPDSGIFNQNESKLFSSMMNQNNLLSSSINRNGGQLDEHTATRFASEVVLQCHIAQLIEDSKFLVDASLIELIKALLCATRGDVHATLLNNFDFDSMFSMDGLLHITSQSVQNSVNSDSGIFTSLSTTGSNAQTSTYISEAITGVPTQQYYTSLPQNSLSSTSPPLLQWIGSASSTASYYSPCNSASDGTSSLDDCRVFCLELLIRVLMHNRDRFAGFWSLVRYHLADVLLSTRPPNHLVERIIVGFLRLAICLLRRHEVTSQIFATLYWLLLNHGEQLMYYVNAKTNASSSTLRQSGGGGVGVGGITSPKMSNSRSINKKSSTVGVNNVDSMLLALFKQGSRVGRQVIAGLTDLLRNHAADLPDPTTDWKLIFGLLEVCGAGRRANIIIQKGGSDKLIYANKDELERTTLDNSRQLFPTNGHESNRGYTSDSETLRTVHDLPPPPVSSSSSLQLSNTQYDKVSEKVNEPITSVNSSSEVDPTTLEINKKAFSESYDVLSKLSISEIQNPIMDKSSLFTTPLVLSYEVPIGSRDPVTLEQATDCLAFLVRDPAHITPDNFEYAVQALRVFVEACLHRPPKHTNKSRLSDTHSSTNKINTDTRRPPSDCPRVSSNHQMHHHNQRHCHYALSDSDTDNEYHEKEKCRKTENGILFTETMLSPVTSVIAIQLLDLISILFTRAISIYTEWTKVSFDRVTPSCAATNDDGDVDSDKHLNSTRELVAESTLTNVDRLNLDHLWTNCWRPLLQATARLCSDIRRDVRTDALSYLQKALLSPTLHSLNGKQWEDCFDKVLFPLLSGFLESIALEEAIAANSQRENNIGSVGAGGTTNHNSNSTGYGYHLHTVEFADPRMRAIPLLTKVYLQHLRPLYELDTFNVLWIRMLAYMERYMLASSSDSLTDAVRESLKNVLLVMCTGTHDINPILIKNSPPGSNSAILWELTEKHLSTFLPELLEQLFPSNPPETMMMMVDANVTPVSAMTKTTTTTVMDLPSNVSGEAIQVLSDPCVNEVTPSQPSVCKLTDNVPNSDIVVVEQCVNLQHDKTGEFSGPSAATTVAAPVVLPLNQSISAIQNL